MRGVARDALVDTREFFDDAAQQAFRKFIGPRLRDGVFAHQQRVVIAAENIFERRAPLVPLEQQLKRLLSCAMPGHQVNACNLRSRFAISIAVMAASNPLLPFLPPARSTACSTVLVVRSPNAMGTPVSTDAFAMPRAASPAT